MPTPDYLRLEALIARAHRACYEAEILAGGMQLDELAHDFAAMQFALEAHQEALLKGRPRRHPLIRDRT
jgi:hypothetical protein